MGCVFRAIALSWPQEKSSNRFPRGMMALDRIRLIAFLINANHWIVDKITDIFAIDRIYELHLVAIHVHGGKL